MLAQLKLLKGDYEAMTKSTQGHWYLDLEGTGKNILVVGNGGLRCVDTNVVYPYRERSRLAGKFKRDLRNLSTFIERLERYYESIKE